MDDTSTDLIENVTASLVREYLSRKGLKSALRTLDQELPRHKDSINNRGILIQLLRLEKAVKQNKISLHPFRTLLEIVIKELLGKYQQCKAPAIELENSSTFCSSFKILHNGSEDTLSARAEDKNLIKDSLNNEAGEKTKIENNTFTTVHKSSLSSIKQKPVEQDNLTQSLYSEHESISAVSQTSKDQNYLANKELFIPMAKSKEIESHSYHKHSLGFGPVSSTSQNSGEPWRLRTSTSSSVPQSVCLKTYPSIRMEEREKNFEETYMWHMKKKGHRNTFNQNLSNELKENLTKEVGDLNTILLSKINKEKSSKMDMTANTKALLIDTKNDIELCDVSDSEDPDISNMSVRPYIKPSQVIPDYSCIRPITVEEAYELKKILFGSQRECFGKEWTEQGFCFCNIPSLTYGIIQKKAGPCGVLAAVQAHVLSELLFGTKKNCLQSGCLRPKQTDQVEALAKALSTILWQAGEKTQAVLAVNTGRTVIDNDDFTTPFKTDGILECLVLRVFNCYDVLLNFLRDIIPKLEADGSCVTFLCSAILTRGIERIRNDMDHPNSHLIGQYGYCSQEIVNLLLVGQAVPNVFDGDVELNTGGKDKTVLHGIPVPSKIGLLSLYEYQNTCEVGNYYKSPQFPIWIVLGESHFSVLFATSKDVMEKMKFGEPFILFYFDGLANQEKEISLTVDPAAGKPLTPGSDDDYLSSLERCIRTRWKGSRVDWKDGTPPA